VSAKKLITKQIKQEIMCHNSTSGEVFNMTTIANKSRYYDCLNEAVTLLSIESSGKEMKAKADELYKEKGFSSLPFLEKQSVLKEYFN
jgi:hypothetical protein